MADEGLDTPLARLLHQRGRLPLDTLRAVLAEARAARALDGASLAARLVERALLSADEAEAALRELRDPSAFPTASGPARGPQLEPGAPAGWAPGSTVGEYRLVRRLGAGGMGTVDLGEHLRTGASHAIKSLPATADPELLMRFRREAEALARVDGHPNVVRIHTVGQAAGRHYLVMDVAAGGDLLARLRSGPLAPADAVALGVALCRGLEHVHRNGILHRDLKPQNVLFDGPGPDARPLLVDFGLARAAGSASLTASGELLGTPAYMAPEQARGERDALSPATDVYGVGALLFHALTGRPPFSGRTPFEVLARVVSDPTPSARSVAPAVPPALDDVLRRAMAKDPSDRPPTARALGAALEGALRPARRSGGRVIALAAGALCAAGAAGLALAFGLPGGTGPTSTATGSDAREAAAREAAAREAAAREAATRETAADEADRLAAHEAELRRLVAAGRIDLAAGLATGEVPADLRWPIGLHRIEVAVDGGDLEAAARRASALDASPLPDALRSRARAIARRALDRVQRALVALGEEPGRPRPEVWQPAIHALEVARRLDPAGDRSDTVRPLLEAACGFTRGHDQELALALAEATPDDLAVQRAVAQLIPRVPTDQRARFVPAADRAARLAPTAAEREHLEAMLIHTLAEAARSDECLARAERVLPGMTEAKARARVHAAVSVALDHQGSVQESLAAIDSSLALVDDAIARGQRARLLRTLGREDEALAEAARSFALGPDPDTYGHDRLVTIVWTLGRTRPDCREMLRQALDRLILARRPSVAFNDVRAALLALEDGDVERARAHLEAVPKHVHRPTLSTGKRLHFPGLVERCQALARRASTASSPEERQTLVDDLRSLTRELDVFEWQGE